MLVNVALVLFWRVVPDYRNIDVPLDSLPWQLGRWKGIESKELDARSQLILNLDRYLKRIYRTDNGEVVQLYVGYWKKQSGETQAAKHSPILCLPANGWTISRPVSSAVSMNQVPAEQSLQLATLEGTLNAETSLFKYWFFNGTDTYPDQSKALLHTSVAMVTLGRSDGGIVELTTQIDRTVDGVTARKKAEAALSDFLSVFYPEFYRLLASASPHW